MRVGAPGVQHQVHLQQFHHAFEVVGTVDGVAQCLKVTRIEVEQAWLVLNGPQRKAIRRYRD